MKYKIYEDKIEITEANTFDIKSILESGQMFRFKQTENEWIVQSGDKVAKICQVNDKKYILKSKNLKYFENFFDFQTNYDIIQAELNKFSYMRPALEFSKGVRILKQQPLETLICFIISANNNISRIKKSVNYICEHFGQKLEENLFAFPTLDELLKITEKDFMLAGTGYRAPYLVKTIKELENGFSLEQLKHIPTEEAKQKLLTLAGVGPKVADCVLLFGLQHKKVFPVDTWIAKVYNDFFEHETNRIKMRKKLVGTFGDLSGIAQQYLFYYKREIKN
ncbi:MAG: hypothetical protein IJ837_01900 [Clostridia bacterium]|nr:hypothetical protein [Clostridia bacterium]